MSWGIGYLLPQDPIFSLAQLLEVFILNSELILYYFSMFTNLSEEDALKWEELCLACAENVYSRLRPNVDLEANKKRVSFAAALLASYRYELLIGGTQPGSVKIGDVSFSGASTSFDKGIKKECFEMISDLINSQSVFIQEVPITI